MRLLAKLAAMGLPDAWIGAGVVCSAVWDQVLRPTPAFAGDRRPIFDARVRDKRWLERWPLLRLVPAAPPIVPEHVPI